MPADAPALPDVRPFAELARGPIASVFKAFDAQAGETVLLKALGPGAAADPERRARFAAEARLAATVQNPNVVRVRRVADDGTAFVAEWVEGRSLRDVLDAEGALPAALAAYVAREMARGLAAIHAAGILHRDVTPANVLLGLDGSVRLTDFGLASLADEAPGGEVRGTLATMAPEIVQGESARPASDLFSLGAVLAHALTGAAPFARPTSSETLGAVLHADAAATVAADPRVPSRLATVVASLLDRAPEARPAAAALADALDGAMDALGRTDASDLAVFLDAPADYRPPELPAVHSVPLARAAHPDAAPLQSPSWRRWAAVGAGLCVATLAALVAWPRPATRTDAVYVAPRGPADTAVVRIQPLAADTAAPLIPGVLATDEASSRPPAPVVSVPPAETAALPGVASPPSGTPIPSAEPASPEQVRTPARPGSLVVEAEPWAAVRIDGRPVGNTPVAPLTLAAGVHEVTFENPAFPPYTATVRVASDETARASVSLWSLVARVTLDVAPWAEVWVDGQRWDTVPPQSRPLVLTPGAHTLRFEHPSLGRRETTLRVAAGEQRTVQVRMATPAR